MTTWKSYKTKLKLMIPTVSRSDEGDCTVKDSWGYHRVIEGLQKSALHSKRPEPPQLQQIQPALPFSVESIYCSDEHQGICSYVQPQMNWIYSLLFIYFANFVSSDEIKVSDYYYKNHLRHRWECLCLVHQTEAQTWGTEKNQLGVFRSVSFFSLLNLKQRWWRHRDGLVQQCIWGRSHTGEPRAFSRRW